MLTIRWGRIALGALVAEAVPIAALVGLVAAFGPGVQTEDKLLAARLGRWIGPLGGSLMCFLAALWVTRRLVAYQILHGILLGVAAALLDCGLLLASGAAFEWIFVVSNAGRIGAGAVGGIVASHGWHRRTNGCS
jgi:hypothetical protein